MPVYQTEYRLDTGPPHYRLNIYHLFFCHIKFRYTVPGADGLLTVLKTKSVSKFFNVGFDLKFLLWRRAGGVEQHLL